MIKGLIEFRRWLRHNFPPEVAEDGLEIVFRFKDEMTMHRVQQKIADEVGSGFQDRPFAIGSITQLMGFRVRFEK